MTSLSELTSQAKNELNALLVDGVNELDRFQEWTFTKYVRKVLPLDGYVFWVRADLLEEDARGSGPDTVTLKGYLHLTTDNLQDDEEIYDKNIVTFTATEHIDPFNEVSNETMYISEFFGLKFAFDLRSNLNAPADLYHYRGEAVYPRMLTQFVDDLKQLDLNNVVVSNSLPIWMGLDGICPMFPARLSEHNFAPPYGSIKIRPARPLAGGFGLDSNSTMTQLVCEEVEITLTGLRNSEAMDFIRLVTDYTLSPSTQMGVMNVPVIVDKRDNQNEFNILAMRKVIVFEVNYYQTRMEDVSRGLILKAGINIKEQKIVNRQY